MLFRRSLLLSALPCLLLACNSGGASSGGDPVADAKFQNEKRIAEQNVTERQERDAEFMVEAATASRFGQELGQLAQTRATNPALKAFGQQLTADHAALDAALRRVGQQKELVLPNALAQEQQETLARLLSLSGPAFDKELGTAIEDQLDKAHEAFDDMSEDAYDGDIRAVAAKYAATLKDHRNRADELAGQLQ